MSDDIFYRKLNWQLCQEHARKKTDLDRVALRLRPISVPVFAQNKQMAITSPFVMPASQLAVTEKALQNPDFATWDLFSAPAV